jgi:hypothetical protein
MSKSTVTVAPAAVIERDTDRRIQVDCNEPLCESFDAGHSEWYDRIEGPNPLHRHLRLEGEKYEVRIERFDADATWDICVDVDHNGGEFDAADALEMAGHLTLASVAANRLNGVTQ